MSNSKGIESPHSTIFNDLLIAKSNSIFNNKHNYIQGKLNVPRGGGNNRRDNTLVEDLTEEDDVIDNSNVDLDQNDLATYMRCYFDPVLNGQNFKAVYFEGRLTTDQSSRTSHTAKEKAKEQNYLKNAGSKFVLGICKLPEFDFLMEDPALPMSEFPQVFPRMALLSSIACSVLSAQGMLEVDPMLFLRKFNLSMRNLRTNRVKSM